MARFIFVTGGVVSSLGKGLSSASLAYLLQSRGYKVRLRKLDPYLNVDPGTMSPFQHGEVFVTNDGAETDLDLGHYERFSGVSAKKSDNITTGKIYNDVLKKQLLDGLKKLKNLNKIIIAYEPVWSIGTGIIPSENDLKKNIRFIRNTLKISKKFTKSKILYGGSVNPKNIKNLMRIDNIDGFLIGGASTNEKIFIDIMKKSIN